jgi:L-erythro-3,5-diaminohexanoate dehydrogenase
MYYPSLEGVLPKNISGSSYGVHRVLDPQGALPQAAYRLNASPALWPDEMRVRVERLNLDAASFRQFSEKYSGDGNLMRHEVLEIIRQRGKLQNPVTGSGGMLIGVVEEIGPTSPHQFQVGDRVASLASLTLTPLVITDGLAQWKGQSAQVPTRGHAILFASASVVELPDELSPEAAISVFDVCGAPALTARVVGQYTERGQAPKVAVIGAAGKSGSLSAASARQAGAGHILGVVLNNQDAIALEARKLVDEIVVADARHSLELADAIGRKVDVTVVCVDAPGCEQGSILVTDSGGTIVFFSMATSFTAAALGAEGVSADVTMLIGNGFVPGHAQLALELIQTIPTLRELFEEEFEHGKS